MTAITAYATAAHVQSYLNSLGGNAFVLGVSSTPTLAETESWLDQVAAEIDSVLIMCGYETVPATGTRDLILIQRFLAEKVAAMVWEAGFMSDEFPAKIKAWREDYDDFIERLTGKKLRLPDQVPSAGSKTAYITRMRVLPRVFDESGNE